MLVVFFFHCGGPFFFMISQRIHEFILRPVCACTFCHFMFRLDTTFIASHAPKGH
jgi:hypothetical protein